MEPVRDGACLPLWKFLVFCHCQCRLRDLTKDQQHMRLPIKNSSCQQLSGINEWPCWV